jgi:hypothetical protein
MKKPSRKLAFLSTLLVIALLALVIVLDTKRREASLLGSDDNVAVDVTTEEGRRQQKNAALAKQVISLVKAHIVIPDEPEPTVATIVDIDVLRTQNAFYNKAENGDHLIVTTERAILYDPDRDVILDVVPVQIRPPTDAPPPAEGEEVVEEEEVTVEDPEQGRGEEGEEEAEGEGEEVDIEDFIVE